MSILSYWKNRSKSQCEKIQCMHVIVNKFGLNIIKLFSFRDDFIKKPKNIKQKLYCGVQIKMSLINIFILFQFLTLRTDKTSNHQFRMPHVGIIYHFSYCHFISNYFLKNFKQITETAFIQYSSAKVFVTSIILVNKHSSQLIKRHKKLNQIIGSTMIQCHVCKHQKIF